MKNRLIRLIALGMALCAPMACSKKTQEAPEAPTPQPAVQATETPAPAPAVKGEAPLDGSNVDVEALPNNIRDIAPIQAAPLDSLQKLDPEKLEETVLKAFNKQASDNDEFKTLKERAAIGDDAAKEAFIKAVFKRPHTDPEYKTAIQYLTTIRKFSDADVMFQRGLYEFSHIPTDASAKERAADFFKQAAEKDHEPALEFLLQNMLLDLREYALEKLNVLYAKKAETGDAKAQYEWARVLEFAPATEIRKAEELLKKSADAGYGPAQFTLAMSIIEENWDEALGLIKKAAMNGTREAWLFQANLYAMAAYTDSPDEANQLGLVTLDQEKFDKLKAEVNASRDPKLLVVETARKAGGYDEACSMLEAIASNQDSEESTVKARAYAIECRKAFVAAIPSRDACDRAYDQMTYANDPEVDVTQVYTPNQLAELGNTILSCYLNALDNGEDFPQETPFIDFSTALQIAMMYSGESKLRVEPDHAKEIAYVTYAATHGDIFGQMFLANNYDKGKYLPQNTPRSCYWAQRAAGSHICTNFCNDKDNASASVCSACIVVNDMLITCKQIAETEQK